jgi:hypothetical protein
MKTGTEKINTASRFIGLGYAPDSPGLGAAGPDGMLQCGFTQVPVIEYVTWTSSLPLTDEEIESTFGNEVDVLQNPKSVIGVDSVDSSFVMNGLLQCDMLCIGFGVHVFGEPFSFTTIGNSIPTNSTAPIWSPDVFTEADVTNFALAPEGTPQELAPPQAAILEWGFPAWEAAWEFANAYQTQWIMQQRYLLINELTADVCYFGPYAEAVAAGTSEVAVQPYALSANTRYRNKNSPSIFQPVIARRVGSLTTAAPASGSNLGVFHPTRDYDLAPVTHGGLRNQGGFANGHPFRKLRQPVLLEKGVPIGILFRVQDEVHQKSMQRYMSISESLGGLTAIVPFDAQVNGLTGTAGTIGVEITADTALTTAEQRVNTDRVLYKGGAFKLAVLIKGFEVWGAWKQYIVNNWQSQVSMPGIAGVTAPMGMLR